MECQRHSNLDHGFGNIKTAHCCFRTGVTAYDKKPIFTNEMLIEADPEKEKEEALLTRIEETIQRTIAESPIGNLTTLMRLFQTMPAASVPATAVTPPEPALEEQPEEDWNAADDFMSGF